MKTKLLATRRAQPGETTYSDSWIFSEGCTVNYEDGCVLVLDNSNEGTQESPYCLILQMADYERIVLVKGE